MRNALRESPRRREKRRQRFSGGYGGPAGLGKQRSGPVGFGARLSRSGAIQWPCQRFESRRRVESARASPRTEGLRHVVEKKAQIRRRSPHRPARLCRFRGISAPLSRQLRGRVRRAGFAAIPDIFHHLCFITAAPMLCASRLCRQGTSRQTSADVQPMRSPARPKR